MKIKKIILTVLLFVSSIAIAQWPVNGGLQGTVTGTIGEVRNTSGRIHNGTDCIGNNQTVYAINDDQINKIFNSASLGNNRNITMTSGTIYRHVIPSPSIVANQFAVDQVNAGLQIILLTQNQSFATMVNQPSIHVHMETANNSNFLSTLGFSATNFTFLDNVLPEFGGEGIKLYKDLNTDAKWNSAANRKFNNYITDEAYPANEQPLIIYGDVDIVANTFQKWINGSGNSYGSGHLAPYSMGYNLKNLVTNAIEFDEFNNIQFDYGYGTTNVTTDSQVVYRKIHSNSSTSANPFFIVSNKFYSGAAIEDNLSTSLFNDGDYEITVRSKGSVGTPVIPLVAPILETEKIIKVRFDNYKTYIKKVTVADENNLVKYFSQWSNFSQIGDGSIILEQRTSQSFKSGTTANITVITSEKVPSLNLNLASGPAINMTAVGTDGTQWNASFTLPSSASGKVPLKFSSGSRIFGLILNQESADVKRNVDGEFTSQSSTDKNHELRVCPIDYPLAIQVNVVNGVDVTVIAEGGTAPYEYSIDEMPISPNHVSNFSTNSNFTIEFDKNYIFKVRDDGGCQAEKYYTLPKVPCDAQTNAGGVGTDIKQVNLGNVPGMVFVNYEMYGVPDQITLNYRDLTLTTGIVSGSGTLSFEHIPITGQSNIVTVTMFAPQPGTAWNYQVNCPDNSNLRQSIQPESENETVLISEKRYITVASALSNNNSLYDIYFREFSKKNWEVKRGVELPYKISTEGREFEIKTVKSESKMTNNKLIISPNPSEHLINMTYFSNTDGFIDLTANAIDGRLISKKRIHVVEGINNIDIDSGTCISGILFLTVTQNGHSSTAKAILK